MYLCTRISVFLTVTTYFILFATSRLALEKMMGGRNLNSLPALVLEVQMRYKYENVYKKSSASSKIFGTLNKYIYRIFSLIFCYFYYYCLDNK